jgi:single-strand DNA-binding protein
MQSIYYFLTQLKGFIMSLSINGTGNLGRDLTALRIVKGKDDKEYTVTDFTVGFDKVGKKADGTYEQTSLIWAKVIVWGALAERCFDLLKRGYRVNVVGEMVNHSWTDKETDEVKNMLQIEATDVTLSLYRLEEVAVKPKRELAAA